MSRPTQALAIGIFKLRRAGTYPLPPLCFVIVSSHCYFSHTNNLLFIAMDMGKIAYQVIRREPLLTD